MGAGLGLAALGGFAITAPRQAEAADHDYDGTVQRTDGVEGKVISQGNPLVNAQVWDIEFIGNTAYVAGKFTHVVQSTTTWDRQDQPFLAAFDGSTGQWKPGFRPRLDGPAWALDQNEAGQLLVGGEFASVNGQPRRGLVALDRTTGATIAGFGAQVDRPDTDLLAIVRDLDVHDGKLYVIGNFSRAIGSDRAARVSKAIRFDAANGNLDDTWAPVLAGRSGWAVNVSTDGKRVHLGGEFSYINAEPDTDLYGTVNLSDGTLVADHLHGFRAERKWGWPVGGIVFDLDVHGDSVFLTGAEHFWEQRSSTTGEWTGTGLNYRAPGTTFINDTQSAEVIGDRVFIGCHCIQHWGFGDLTLNAATGAVEKNITAGSVQGGEGMWATAMAPDQCLWFGGDFRASSKLAGTAEGRFRWTGRFLRICPTAGPQPIPPGRFDDVPLVSSGANWWISTAATWPAGWEKESFSGPNWARARTEFGYGDGDEITVIDKANRPAAVIGRLAFQVADPTAFKHLILDVAVDDGASIWINGKPVAALRLDEGSLSAQTLANAGVWGAAERNKHRFLLPASAVKAGRNVLAISVHQAWPSSVDLGFDLALFGSPVGPAEPLTPAPNLTFGDEKATLRAASDPLVWYPSEGAPGAGWTALGFPEAGWSAGSGRIGVGEDDLDTTLPAGRSAYYARATFTVDDPGVSATISVERDDGVIVYVNGTEVGRDNMPAGATAYGTLANRLLWGAAERNPVTFTVPAGLLKAGENVVAAEIHQGHVDSRDATLSLAVSG